MSLNWPMPDPNKVCDWSQADFDRIEEMTKREIKRKENA